MKVNCDYIHGSALTPETTRAEMDSVKVLSFATSFPTIFFSLHISCGAGGHKEIAKQIEVDNFAI